MERLVYGAFSAVVEQLVALHIRYRCRRGLEHHSRWRERLGYASLPRPAGPVIWFHAVSLGEGLAALPIIQRFIQMRPWINVLMTAGTLSAFYALEDALPKGVLFQFVPVDTPAAVFRFLAHWHPEAGIVMESELWPNLILSSKIPLALLNARMSERSFRRWSNLNGRSSLISEMLGSFSLICPLSNEDAVRLQLLGAPPARVFFAGNSKYAWAALNRETELRSVFDSEFMGRHVWLASSTHPGEEEVIIRVHIELKRSFPSVLTVIAPRHPRRARSILLMIRDYGLKAAQRSTKDKVCSETDIYLADTIGELKNLYSSVPIAFVGGSLLHGLAGHNMAEAAACGCAVLTGQYVGHFSKMLAEMRSIAPSSVRQVLSENDLLLALIELLGDENKLQASRQAAKCASSVAAVGVVDRIWSLLDIHVLEPAGLGIDEQNIR